MTNQNKNMLEEKVLTELNIRKGIFETSAAQKNALDLKVQVEIAFDSSGSMPPLYRNGTVQAIIEAIFPFASYFNQEKELNLCTFSHDVKKHKSVTESNLYNYTLDEIFKNRKFPLCGRREFYPLMHDIFTRDQEADNQDCTRLVFIVTNGNAYDQDRYQELLLESSHKNIFWQFISLETALQGNLLNKELLAGQGANNIGFLGFPIDRPVFHKRFYDLFLNKFLLWEKEARLKGIISRRSQVA